MPAYLSAAEASAINEQFLGVPALRDETALLAALARPITVAYYQNADLAGQAAILIEGIATAHAFIDANKRTATAAGLVFLRLNGYRVEYRIDPANDELGQLVVALVTHQISVDALAGWLRVRLVATPA